MKLEANRGTQPSLRLQRTTSVQLEINCPDDDSLLLFHSKSGDTHCLNLVDATAFRKLPVDIPIAFEQWIQQIASDLVIDVDNELIAYLRELVHQFDELGIAHYLSA